MIKLKLKKRTSHNKVNNSNNLEVSIQLSLDGFSFCILNDQNEIVNATKYDFAESCITPEELLNRVKEIFEKDANLHYNFINIMVVHQNNLNTLVPVDYFDDRSLKSYLSYSVKTFSSDYITFDNVASINAKNVFVPFVNINNYLLDHFGDFNFYHHQTLLLEKLAKLNSKKSKKVIVHIGTSLMDILVLESEKLHLINSFDYQTKEDFVYYLLFVYEQLQLDANDIPLEIIGNIDIESELYQIVYKYIRHIKLIEEDNSIIKENKAFKNGEFFLLTP